LKMDIRHLNLRAALNASASLGPVSVVAYSKHLCGVATDLTLRCLHNFVASRASETESAPVRGIAIALCCHSLCEWSDFCGRDLFTRRVPSFSAADFAELRAATGWATGFRSVSFHPEMSAAERAARVRIGRLCKRLIDAGRVNFLQERMGLRVKLMQYCDEDISAENVLLIAGPEGGA
jgi:tRNA:m4X modification enzyme